MYLPIDHYLAGVFDGEGSIGVYHYEANGTHVVVRVGMCNESLPRLFKERFGGQVFRAGRLTTAGKVVWIWNCFGPTAEPALRVFQALCRIKAEQATLALEAIRLMRPVKHRSPNRKRITEEELTRRREIAAQVKQLKSVS